MTTTRQGSYLLLMLQGWNFWDRRTALSRVVQHNLAKQNARGHGNAALRRQGKRPRDTQIDSFFATVFQDPTK